MELRILQGSQRAKKYRDSIREINGIDSLIDINLPGYQQQVEVYPCPHIPYPAQNASHPCQYRVLDLGHSRGH